MPGKLAQEIVQEKPWTCLEEEAFLNIAKTYEFLSQGLSELFSGYQISMTQYNVLRILRGAGAEGLNCTEAARRMITHDPDITRLFDRLEARHLIRRSRSTSDRRVVKAAISEDGLRLLAELDAPVLALHAKQMTQTDPARLQQLIDTLELLRP